MRYVSSITCSLIPLHLFHPPVRAWFDAVSPAPTRPPQFGWPARALAETGGDDSALLPHLKARAGETQPAVTGQVLLIAPRDGAPRCFPRRQPVSGRCPSGGRRDRLALGGSRRSDAVDVLMESWLSTSRGKDALERSWGHFSDKPT